jgi:hypothetical protein
MIPKLARQQLIHANPVGQVEGRETAAEVIKEGFR